jgi:iron-sulfur cluster repair protein YtfE (RIC family)
MARPQGNGNDRSAIDMLLQDHKRVQKLFKDFEKIDRADEEAVRELVETACLELQIHSMLEEEIFYPAVRAQAQGESEDLLNEAEVEHEAADDLIARLHELEADDPMYCAYFTVLAEYVRHHVKEEEHELFPRAEKMKLDFGKLGEDMRVRREELFAEMEREDEESDESEAPGRGLSAQPGEVPMPEPEDEELEDEQEQIDISRTRH